MHFSTVIWALFLLLQTSTAHKSHHGSRESTKHDDIIYLLTVTSKAVGGTREKLCVQFKPLPRCTYSLMVSLEHKQTRKLILNMNAIKADYSNCVPFQLPDVNIESAASIRLLINGDKTSVNRTTEIIIKRRTELIFVETDKPFYKPGQTVNFRIVSLNTDFLIYNQRFPKIELLDPRSNRIGQWLNVSTSSGLVDLSYPSNTESPHGHYIITMWNQKRIPRTRSFEIREYVLPPFEVTIECPPVITILDTTATVKVCATYSHEAPVNGSVKTVVCRSGFKHGFLFTPRSNPTDLCKTYSMTTDNTGCSAHLLDLNDFALTNPFYQDLIRVSSEVKEFGTGVIRKVSGSTTVTAEIATVRFEDAPPAFKAGINYRGKVKVTGPDSSPLKSKAVTLTITSRRHANTVENLVTNDDGIAQFSLETEQWGQTSVTLEAQCQQTDQVRVIPAVGQSNSRIPNYPSAYQTIQPFFSNSRSFLSLERSQEPLSCAQNAVVKAQYLIQGSALSPQQQTLVFFYMVMARGKLAQQGKVPMAVKAGEENRGEVSFQLQKMKALTPVAQVVIYTLLPTGEVVADSMNFPVQLCLPNKVSLSFTSQTELPGENATLELRADPGSLCSLRAIDQNLLLLKPEKQLTVQSVFDLLPVKTISGYPNNIDDEYTYCSDSPFGKDRGKEKHIYKGRGMDNDKDSGMQNEIEDEGRGMDKVKNMDKSKGMDKDKERGIDKDQFEEKDINRSRDKGRGRDKDEDKDRGMDKDKDKDRDKDRDKDKDDSRGIGKDDEKDKSRGKGKDDEKDKNKNMDKDDDKDKISSMDMDKVKDKEKDMDKDKNRGKGKDDDKDKISSMDMDKVKDKDRDMDKDKNRGKGKDDDKDKISSMDTDKVKDKEKDRDKDKIKGKSKDDDMDKSSGMDIDKEKDKEKGMDKDKNRGKGKDDDKDKSSGMDTDKEKEKEKDRDKDKNRGKSKDDKDKSSGMDKDKDKEKGMHKSEDESKSSSKDMYKEKDKNRDMDKDKNRVINKDDVKGKKRGKRTVRMPMQQKFDIPYIGNDVYNIFKDIGIKILTNAVIKNPTECSSPNASMHRGEVMNAPAKKTLAAGVSKSGTVSTVRKYFAETWIWDLVPVSQTGVTRVFKTVPASTTTWEAEAFCMSSAGFGISPKTKLTAFQPFTLSLSTPSSVIRGEVITLKATVFNYLQNCLMVKVTLGASQQFTVQPCGTCVYTRCLCANESFTFTWTIKPQALGELSFSVTAEAIQSSSLCGTQPVTVPQKGRVYTVISKLQVLAEGNQQTQTYNELIRVSGAATEKNFSLTLPEVCVRGSASASVSVLGDLMGRALKNLASLLAMPYGCGEQNMLRFAPNIFILQYLESSAQLTVEIKNRAETFLISGYQRQLTYKRNDGSFSAFGMSDLSGNTWLTAFVMKSFASAKRYIFIAPLNVEKARAWLGVNQKVNGCFASVGRLIHNNMKGGVNDEVTLSAYITAALLELGVNTTDPVVTKSLKCLRNGYDEVTSTYAIALLSYTFTLAGDQTVRTTLLTNLNGRAIVSGAERHWSRENVVKVDSLEVEMTSYVLLALLSGPPLPGLDMSYCASIVNWLVEQQNAYGGFASTQDTVVALQALAKYSAVTYSPAGSVTVTVTSPSGVRKEFTINQSNRLRYQVSQLQEVPGRYKVKAEGTGSVYVQFTLYYFIPPPADNSSFSITLKTKGNCKARKRTVQVTVTVKYNGDRVKTNMVIIDVKLLSGFRLEKTSVKQLNKPAEIAVGAVKREPRSVHHKKDDGGEKRKVKSEKKDDSGEKHGHKFGHLIQKLHGKDDSGEKRKVKSEKKDDSGEKRGNQFGHLIQNLHGKDDSGEKREVQKQHVIKIHGKDHSGERRVVYLEHQTIKLVKPIGVVKRVEQSEGHAIIYLDELEQGEERSYSMLIVQEMALQSLKPAVIKVYDYYEINDVAVVQYTSPCV